MSEGRDTTQIFGGKSPSTDGTTDFRPQMVPNMLWRDIGSSGLRQYGGWIREEFLRALQGREAARVFREMRDNNPTIGALLFAIHQVMRKIEWREEAQSDDATHTKYTDFANSLREDMSEPWNDFVAEALSMLEFGFAPHEIVYKRRDGFRKPASYNVMGKPIGPGSSRPDYSNWNEQDRASSKYNDGLVGIRRLPLRGQETILRWYFDPNGVITGMQQQPWMGPLIDIPVEKLLIFRPMHYKGNPEGRSILRNCYRPYFFSKRIEEEEAILFERMNGLPVLHVPSALLEQATLSSPAGLAAAQTLAEYKKIITNLRIDEQMGVILPSDTFEGPNGPTNVRRFELELLTPKAGGGHAIDSDKVLHRYSLDMLKTAMADFIDLGHQARGTQNLAISKVDMFFQAISGWLYSLADVLNRYMLVRVWQLNGWDEGTVPQYVPDLAQRIDLDSIGNFILRLSQAGARMFPDNDLENYLRDAAGMPDLDDDADYQPLQQLVNPASQVITQPGAQPTTAQPVTTPVPATTAGARGASGVKKPGGARVRGAPTGGAGAGGPFGKNQTAGGAVADAILYEVAKAQRRARPPYRVQGDRGKLKRTVRAAA